ncbi:tail fiber assembly protein [Pseudomonas gingeri]|uniref:tail fiber assembly protein n=1 Tax=Pseudomonas TaxID=286 RepID=UPI0015BE3E22|nr:MULTISPECIES: tail fiber assembly protein [Pseudomonas]NWE69946.1 tail fiber assembly protein [Pseudomonas gingeri]
MTGYAVRNDGQGWREVDSLNDVEPDERFTTDTPPEPIALPPVLTDLVKLAKGKREQLLFAAGNSMGPLQDAVDLNEATVDEVDRLRGWKQYRIALNRIEQQPDFPTGIVWPVSPE